MPAMSEIVELADGLQIWHDLHTMLGDVHARVVRLGGGGLVVPTNQPVAKRRGHVVLLQYWQGIEARSGRWEHMPQRLLLIERTHRD